MELEDANTAKALGSKDTWAMGSQATCLVSNVKAQVYVRNATVVVST